MKMATKKKYEVSQMNKTILIKSKVVTKIYLQFDPHIGGNLKILSDRFT